MTRDRILRLTQSAICVICIFLIWRYTLPLDGTEFSGGRISGPLLDMAHLGMLLFMLALILSFFRGRPAAVISLAACLTTLPLYFYFVFPGPFHRIFKGEYSGAAPANVDWSSGSVLGVIAIIGAVIISIYNLFPRQSPQQKPQ